MTEGNKTPRVSRIGRERHSHITHDQADAIGAQIGGGGVASEDLAQKLFHGLHVTMDCNSERGDAVESSYSTRTESARVRWCWSAAPRALAGSSTARQLDVGRVEHLIIAH